MKKTIFALLLCTVLSATVFAQTGDDFDITQNSGGGITITKYRGSVKAVVIPQTIEGIKVTIIGERAFEGNKTITSVTIPDSVTKIEGLAFWDCTKLARITIGANNNYAFGFPNNFGDYYQSQGRKAGTYYWSGRIWSTTPPASQ